MAPGEGVAEDARFCVISSFLGLGFFCAASPAPRAGPKPRCAIRLRRPSGYGLPTHLGVAVSWAGLLCRAALAAFREEQIRIVGKRGFDRISSRQGKMITL